MLVSLRIRNYALIRDLDINFGPGLNVLTGETGAGKSILLGALGLVLGERASSDAITDQSIKCIVECGFDVSGYELRDFFDLADIDYEPVCTIRRELSPSGKSRAFVNDTPVSLELLRELSLSLIEIHSQHSTLSLNRPSTQLSVLDDWAGIGDKVKAYSMAFQDWTVRKEELRKLQDEHEQALAGQEFIMAQYNELKAAAYAEGEKTAITSELSVLEHGEEIVRTLDEVDQLLSDDELGIVGNFSRASQSLNRLASRVDKYNDLAKRFESMGIELQDIASQLSKEADSIDFSVERLAELRERLDTINHLEHKHGVLDEDGLIAVLNELSEKLSNFSGSSSRILRLAADVEKSGNEVIAAAKEISHLRKKGAQNLSEAIIHSLKETGLDDAVFSIDLIPNEEPGLTGFEKARFLFAAHRGTSPGELNRIASGGELSRIMLAIKANISSKRLLPSIIFDEIDSGISGQTATLVGRVMSGLGNYMQVLTITHQPSIAAFGSSHYLVFKEKDATFIHSKIKKLSDNERIEVLAGMIAGGEATEASRIAASELLNNRFRV